MKETARVERPRELLNGFAGFYGYFQWGDAVSRLKGIRQELVDCAGAEPEPSHEEQFWRSMDQAATEGFTYSGEIDWKFSWETSDPLVMKFPYTLPEEFRNPKLPTSLTITVHDLGPLLEDERQNGRCVIKIVLDGYGYRKGGTAAFHKRLVSFRSSLESPYLLGGDMSTVGSYLFRKSQGRLKRQLDVPLDNYLVPIGIYPQDRLGRNWREVVAELPIHEWREMDDSAILLNLFADHDAVSEDDYFAMCKGLDMKCLWHIR
jgi:hypothetical protein